MAFFIEFDHFWSNRVLREGSNIPMSTIFWDFKNCSCVPVSPWEISLVGYGKGLTLKMGSLGSIKRYAEYFDENRILNSRNRLVNFDIY